VPEPAELRDLIDRYCAAVTSRDVDRVVALFTEDAVQRDPATAEPNVGRDAIRTFFAAGLSASLTTDFSALAVHTCGDQVAIDFKVAVTLDGGSMTITGIEVFTVASDGRIAAVTAYWDDADVVFDAG
jgi:steroid delta-isomerase